MTNVNAIRRNNYKAEIGDFTFTMQASTVEGLANWIGTPCWECQQPINEGEEYHVAAIYDLDQYAPVSIGSALIHAHHIS